MADTFVELADILARRIRDPDYTAHSQEDVVLVLRHAERIVNLQNAASISVATLTPGSTFAENPFIGLQSQTPSIQHPLEVAVGPSVTQTKKIPRVSFAALTRDPCWLRARAPLPQMWALPAMNQMALWPQWTTAPVIRVRFIAIPTDVEFITLDDAYEPAILAFAESLLLMRQRLFASLTPAVERFERTTSHGRVD